jgi:hypothetical protein
MVRQPEGVGDRRVHRQCLALESTGEVVGQRDALESATKHELARMQDERFLSVGLDEGGQVVSLLGGVAIQPYIDAGRLQHLGVERVDSQALGVELGMQITVGQQHRPLGTAPIAGQGTRHGQTGASEIGAL